jgi:hypothetical protein
VRARIVTWAIDALHLAFAEGSASRLFVATDERPLQVAITSSMSPHQIRMEGWKALTERLGAAGAMRFMMQYDPGLGDYLKERQDLFADFTIDALLDAVAERNRSKNQR